MALARDEVLLGAGIRVRMEYLMNIVSERGRKRCRANEKSGDFGKIAKHVRLLTPKQRVS